MGHPDGAHTHGSGGGGMLLVVILLVLLVGGAAAKAVSAVWHTIVTVLEIAAYTALSIAGAAMLAGTGYLAWRIRVRVLAARAQRTVPARAHVVQLGAEPPPVTGPAMGKAIEAPRQQAGGWPLPGWWDEVRPHIGGDGS